MLSAVSPTHVNLLFIAPQRAERISWRLCIPSCEISTEDSSWRPRAFPRPSNMSLSEESGCVRWKGPGRPWAGQVLWGFRRSKSPSPPLHCRTDVLVEQDLDVALWRLMLEYILSGVRLPAFASLRWLKPLALPQALPWLPSFSWMASSPSHSPSQEASAFSYLEGLS